MWYLLMIQDPPRPSTAFLPSWQMRGNPPKGQTYGIEMWGNDSYSETLRNLIYECLYEIPEHRPTVRDLKKAVVLGWQDAQQGSGGTGGDPWEDFRMAEPTQSKPELQKQQQQADSDSSDPGQGEGSDNDPAEDTPSGDSSHDGPPRNHSAATHASPPGAARSLSAASSGKQTSAGAGRGAAVSNQAAQNQAAQSHVSKSHSSQPEQTQTSGNWQSQRQTQPSQQGRSRNLPAGNQQSGTRITVPPSRTTNLEIQYSKFVRLTVFVQQYYDSTVLRKGTRWEFRSGGPNNELGKVVTIMTVREFKRHIR